MGKVFSITDFKHGLDVRKTPLTAPGGSLRILENAVLNQGGEIEKRFAFVPLGTIPPQYQIMFGQGDTLHFFGVNTGNAPIPPIAPVPIVVHNLAAPPSGPVTLFDVEAYADRFQVSGYETGVPYTYVWWDNALLIQDGGGYAQGQFSRTYKTKMYRLAGSYLHFSGVNDPSIQDPTSTTNPGAGFINLSINDPEGENSTAMEVYYDKMAVFSRLTTQLWSLDPDPDKDTLQQVLRIGTNAAGSVVQFGTGDILFLSDSGVRSLKALNTTLAASVSDVGSAIDLLLIPVIRASGGTIPPSALFKARAVVQPVQGRYWLHLAGTIYVLSYFPAGEITAWSTFTPGFEVAYFAVVGNQVYVLDTNNILYVYGGTTLNQFDSSKVTVRTPHHSVDSPTTRKRIHAVDVMCEGPWSVSLGMLPNRTDLFELAANIQDNTYGIQTIPFAGYGTHIAAHLEHQAPGPATLAALHFNVEEGSTK
jgi:hypothetical protein